MDTNKRNGLVPIIAQAIEEMEVETGFSIPLENINLAELERRTGLSRSKLRTLQAKGFKEQPHGLKGKPKGGILKGYTGILDSLLSQGITNSVVCLERLRQEGFTGGRTTVKDYIAAHKYLVPVRRTQTAPQGNRGRRYMTGPGEAFQMDWGFTKVLNPNGAEYQVACFAMICHHCGQRYVEFFPNAKQENLFIGMIHAFQHMEPHLLHGGLRYDSRLIEGSGLSACLLCFYLFQDLSSFVGYAPRVWEAPGYLFSYPLLIPYCAFLDIFLVPAGHRAQ